MARESITPHTRKGRAIVELQSVVTEVVAGTTSATNIAVANILTTDTLESVIMFAAGVPSDVTGEASITSNGNIQLSTTNSTGNTLIVRWLDKPAR